MEAVLKARWSEMKEVVMKNWPDSKFNPYVWLTHFVAPTPDLDDRIYRELLAVYEILKVESRDPNNVYNKLYLLDDGIDDP